MSTQRKTYSSLRQLARQQRILECARRAISKVGYDALTMKDLAESSEVSIKTLYNLYSSKDELLMAAVADLLTDLAEQPVVLEAKAGIPRLLARVEAISAQVVATPAYAETMARALFQAGKDNRLVDVLLNGTRRSVLAQLQVAAAEGDLLPGLDLEQTATVLAGHQWSVVLMWSKGLVATADFEAVALRSQLLSLAALCQGEQKDKIVQKLSRG